MLITIKDEYDDLYYNVGESVITDADYDNLKEELISRGESISVGAKLRDGENIVKLPVWMGSMDKIKNNEQKKLGNWITKNPSKRYLISEKLDGISALLILEKGFSPKLYTRGKGEIGVDISNVLKYLKTPRDLDPNLSLIIRGELIVKYDTWKNMKYQTEYSNARSMACGMVKSKTVRQGLSEVEFIGYEVIGRTQDTFLGNQDPIMSQLKYLESIGVKTVRYEIISDLKIRKLSKILSNFNETRKYEIDGIIVQPNIEYVRNCKGNPSYAFAFKELKSENIIPATILDIEWNISRRGALKPRIKIEPIKLQGIEIRHATGFNAKFIEKNKLNKGSIINITRSGDVIPFIVSIVKNSETPLMPDIPFYWGESNIDIYAENGSTKMNIKIIYNFFSVIEAKHVAMKTIEKLYNLGYSNIIRILEMSVSELLAIPRIQEKSANRIYDSIHSQLRKADLPTLMTALGCCETGIGIKKLREVYKNIPNILELYGKIEKSELLAKIININGFSEISAKKVYRGIFDFKIFLENVKGIYTPPIIEDFGEKREEDFQNLIGKKYVFSGVRNREMEEDIISRGGSVVGSVSKNTSAVITNDIHSETGKVKKARDLGIEIIDINEWKYS
jgi:DNA ligase (NAD+)